jgi:hypothetical protein
MLALDLRPFVARVPVLHVRRAVYHQSAEDTMTSVHALQHVMQAQQAEVKRIVTEQQEQLLGQIQELKSEQLQLVRAQQQHEQALKEQRQAADIAARHMQAAQYGGGGSGHGLPGNLMNIPGLLGGSAGAAASAEVESKVEGLRKDVDSQLRQVRDGVRALQRQGEDISRAMATQHAHWTKQADSQQQRARDQQLQRAQQSLMGGGGGDAGAADGGGFSAVVLPDASKAGARLLTGQPLPSSSPKSSAPSEQRQQAQQPSPQQQQQQQQPSALQAAAATLPAPAPAPAASPSQPIRQIMEGPLCVKHMEAAHAMKSFFGGMTLGGNTHGWDVRYVRCRG